MAGKMLVERTIFWPGRSGTDAPLRRRSGRGKQGEDRLRQGAQEDAGSDTPVRGGRAGSMRVSPGGGGKP